MKKRVSNPHQDFANLLLIVLKFLLVIIIGLQGLLRQLGLEPDQITGVVNATPSQQLSEGEFRLSFYALYYAPGANFEHVNYRLEVTPWKCWQNCLISQDYWNALKTSEKENGDGESLLPVSWVRLETRHLTKYGKPDSNHNLTERQSLSSLDGNGDQTVPSEAGQDPSTSGTDTPPEAPGERPSEIFNQIFNLKAADEIREPFQGTYEVIYRVTFVEEDNSGKRHSHWVRDSQGKGLWVIHSPGEEEWRLAPIQIVRGRSAELPPELRAFQLATTEANTRLVVRASSDGPVVSINNYRGLTRNSFEERLGITNRVGSKSDSGNYFELVGSSQRIGVVDARFLRFDPESGNYVRGEFKELSAGNAVYFELSNGNEADLVRYGTEVKATLPVVIEENLPPRSVYRGRGGETDTRVALYFPLNAEYTIVNNSSARIWFFNLNKSIIDPDGLRGGSPSLHIPFGNISRRGNWPARYRLVQDNRTGDTYLTVDPSNLAFPVSGELREDLGFSVSDEWNKAVAITVQVRYLRPEQVDILRAAVSPRPR